MKERLSVTDPEKHLELLRLGFQCDNGEDYKVTRGLHVRAYLWSPHSEDQGQWRADVQYTWMANDPRHPRFDDPIVAAIWIKTELGI